MLFTACKLDDDQASSYNEDLQVLLNLKSEIETLAESSVCNDDSECRFIAFGSKPCGGPWTYLVYSTSIDTDELENKVAQYNQLENIFNVQYGIVSDCALAQEPIDVVCENNKCEAVFQ
jgi:hypothetical protein